MNADRLKPILNYFALFSSASTLICCALPSLFVLLGAGAVFASMLEIFPFLIVVSEHKVALFAVALIALIVSGVSQWYAKDQACPIDKDLAHACAQSKKWTKLIYGFSWLCYLVGAFVTFVLPSLI